jgi:peptide/nickel transport system permease protein
VLLLTIAVAAVLGPSVELVLVIIATTLWTGTARIVYTRMVILRRAPFVEASRALGGSGRHVFIRHLLPHVTPLLVVYASLGIAATVLFEATLSYLGVGVPPPTPTWGTMLADHIGRFATDPRLVLLPGLAITITVLAFNLLGDALRDALDPRAWGS